MKWLPPELYKLLNQEVKFIEGEFELIGTFLNDEIFGSRVVNSNGWAVEIKHKKCKVKGNEIHYA